jgi:hypothetical protein
MSTIGRNIPTNTRQMQKFSQLAELAKRFDNFEGLDSNPTKDRVELGASEDYQQYFDSSFPKGTATFKDGEVDSMELHSRQGRIERNPVTFRVSTDDAAGTRTFDYTRVWNNGSIVDNEKVVYNLATGEVVNRAEDSEVHGCG